MAQPKGDRIQIRIDEFTKDKIERAAHYQHRTLSEFIVINAAVAADDVLAEQEKITLSETDWTLFYDAMIHPSRPNQALRAAFRRYRNRVQR